MYPLKLKERSDAHGFCSKVCSERRCTVSVADALGVMFLFGMFILAMLTYIDRDQKK